MLGAQKPQKKRRHECSICPGPGIIQQRLNASLSNPRLHCAGEDCTGGIHRRFRTDGEVVGFCGEHLTQEERNELPEEEQQYLKSVAKNKAEKVKATVLLPAGWIRRHIERAKTKGGLENATGSASSILRYNFNPPALLDMAEPFDPDTQAGLCISCGDLGGYTLCRRHTYCRECHKLDVCCSTVCEKMICTSINEAGSVTGLRLTCGVLHNGTACESSIVYPVRYKNRSFVYLDQPKFDQLLREKGVQPASIPYYKEFTRSVEKYLLIEAVRPVATDEVHELLEKFQKHLTSSIICGYCGIGLEHTGACMIVTCSCRNTVCMWCGYTCSAKQWPDVPAAMKLIGPDGPNGIDLDFFKKASMYAGVPSEEHLPGYPHYHKCSVRNMHFPVKTEQPIDVYPPFDYGSQIVLSKTNDGPARSRLLAQLNGTLQQICVKFYRNRYTENLMQYISFLSNTNPAMQKVLMTSLAFRQILTDAGFRVRSEPGQLLAFDPILIPPFELMAPLADGDAKDLLQEWVTGMMNNNTTEDQFVHAIADRRSFLHHPDNEDAVTGRRNIQWFREQFPYFAVYLDDRAAIEALLD